WRLQATGSGFGSPSAARTGKPLVDGAFRGLPSGKEADPRVDAHGRPEASHLVRDVSRDALPRVLPPPRLRTVRISGHAPHAGILRTRRRTLPPRAVCASQTPFLGPAAERPLEDRLATHEPRWVMPAFEACAQAMTTARNWVSKVRSRADLLPPRDVGTPELVQSEVAFAGCQAARYQPLSSNSASTANGSLPDTSIVGTAQTS